MSVWQNSRLAKPFFSGYRGGSDGNEIWMMKKLISIVLVVGLTSGLAYSDQIDPMTNGGLYTTTATQNSMHALPEPVAKKADAMIVNAHKKAPNAHAKAASAHTDAAAKKAAPDHWWHWW